MLCQLAANAVDHFASVSSMHKDKDHFRNTNSDTLSNMMGGKRITLGMMVGLILWILLVLIVGKWLWNNVLCQLTTVCKPMPNVLYLIGLIILLDIIRPNMM